MLNTYNVKMEEGAQGEKLDFPELSFFDRFDS